MDKDLLLDLLKKYQEGNCTDEEQRLIEAWYEKYDGMAAEETVPDPAPDRFQLLYEDLNRRLEHEGDPLSGTRRRWFRLLSPSLRVASVIVILFLSVVLVYRMNRPRSEVVINHVEPALETADLQPATNKAILRLGDGSEIHLDDARAGKLAEQGNSTIVKLNSGQIVYAVAHGKDHPIVYNTISTPRGGQYRITLPDGTVVWLNAASSLRFPSAFGNADRHVQLSGEAYFEVKKLTRGRLSSSSDRVPFFVDIEEADRGHASSIQVLGTHFNVMAYADEMQVRTTVVEGAVRVHSQANSVDLKPGDQGILTIASGLVDRRTVDVEEQTAWKNQLFWFNNSDVQSVMRQISRWYDVDVQYNGKVEKVFTGTLPRTMKASNIFKVLEMTGGVHFRIENKKVIVMP
ncbi:MAG TPA: FecR family protein [Flavitalea sp.]|nr:FecR family protein [Flavitalea sp.]